MSTRRLAAPAVLALLLSMVATFVRGEDPGVARLRADVEAKRRQLRQAEARLARALETQNQATNPGEAMPPLPEDRSPFGRSDDRASRSRAPSAPDDAGFGPGNDGRSPFGPEPTATPEAGTPTRPDRPRVLPSPSAPPRTLPGPVPAPAVDEEPNAEPGPSAQRPATALPPEGRSPFDRDTEPARFDAVAPPPRSDRQLEVLERKFDRLLEAMSGLEREVKELRSEIRK